jgi:hypothetical protein
MLRRLIPVFTVLAVLPACASVGERISGPLAEDLASQADAIALSLEQGDPCAADATADQLVGAVEERLADGSIPPDIGRELARRARRLAEDIDCVVPEPSVTETPDEIATDEEDDEGEEGDEEEEEGDSSGPGSGESPSPGSTDSSGEGSGEEGEG